MAAGVGGAGNAGERGPGSFPQRRAGRPDAGAVRGVLGEADTAGDLKPALSSAEGVAPTWGYPQPPVTAPPERVEGRASRNNRSQRLLTYQLPRVSLKHARRW